MKYYFIGSLANRPLGKMLGKYLNMKMNFLYFSEAENFKFNKDDIVYGSGIIPEYVYEKATVVAPDFKSLNLWNNKILQYRLLYDKIPTPDFKIFTNLEEAANKLFKHKYKLFFTTENGTGGNGAIIYNGDMGKVIDKLKDNDGAIRVSKFIDKDFDISTHLFIYDKDNVVMSPIVEQTIAEDGVSFGGGAYPATMSNIQLAKLNEICRIIGETLADDGFKGMTGVDFMVKDNSVIFTELNPRLMTTSFGTSKVMQSIWGTNIPVLTYQILMEDKKPNLEVIGDYKKHWRVKVKGAGIDFREF